MTQGLETGGGDELANIPNFQIQDPDLGLLDRLLFPTRFPLSLGKLFWFF